MKRLLSCLLLLVMVGACSSRKLQKEYKVVDSNFEEVPEWIADYKDWLDDQDQEKNKFYKFETEPKNDREMSCKIAKAQAASHVAGEVKVKIKENLTQAVEGDASDFESKLEEYVSNNLSMDIEASLSGLEVLNSYWEKRAYKKELGADKDFKAWSCTVLLKISKENLSKAIDDSKKKMLKLAKSNSAKETVNKLVEKALE